MNIGTNVYLRKVVNQDQPEFLQLMRASMDMHRPWITPPTTPQMFRIYLQRIRRSDHEGYAICRTDDDRIVGVININHIVRGTFQNASLGYYVGAPFQGHGYMQQGLEQIKPTAGNAAETFVLSEPESGTDSRASDDYLEFFPAGGDIPAGWLSR